MKLAATLDTSQAEGLHRKLLKTAAGGLVDAAGVQSLGQACLQVLLIHRRDRGLRFSNPSASFHEQWTLAGGPPLETEELAS